MPDTTPSTPGKDFIRDMVARDRAAGKHGGRVVTRFPPEPNGYLHIGHAKSICLNFGLALENGGICHLRFDDTNPETEDQEYVESIQRDVRWLGFDWGQNLFYASDYFERLYDFAVELIRLGKAYVDSLSEDEIREYRGTVTEPGRNSPYRDRTVEENLDLFARMRAGEFPDGAHVLRGKIDMASPNMKMRDPLLYRIKHATHYRRGDAWCIYPMYDFAHPLSDAIEGITHSLCTLEFENNRDIYDWLVDTLPFPDPPRQTEFARLNLTYTVMSKRKLLELVERKLVAGWDDPRLPTLAGLRRRGFTPEALRDFCERIGVAKANSTVDVTLLEHCQREDLNPQVPRVLCVLRPLKLVIENYPEGQVEELEAPFYPHDVPKEGSAEGAVLAHALHRAGRLRGGAAEGVPPPLPRPRGAAALRLPRPLRERGQGPGDAARSSRCAAPTTPPPAAARRRTAARCRARCTGSPRSTSVPVEVRLYDRLFRVERPDLEEGGFEACLNPQSLEVLTDSRIEPAAVDSGAGRAAAVRAAGLLLPRSGRFDARPSRLQPHRAAPRLLGAEAQKQAPTAAPPKPARAEGGEGTGGGEGPRAALRRGAGASGAASPRAAARSSRGARRAPQRGGALPQGARPACSGSSSPR